MSNTDTTDEGTMEKTINIPTHLITEEAMGEGWEDWHAAATRLAQFYREELPALVRDSEDDGVEFDCQVTYDSGMVNNPCRMATVDGEDSEEMSFRAQTALEQLWERFCNEFASTFAA